MIFMTAFFSGWQFAVGGLQFVATGEKRFLGSSFEMYIRYHPLSRLSLALGRAKGQGRANESLAVILAGEEPQNPKNLQKPFPPAANN